jgi:hypothetical protein
VSGLGAPRPLWSRAGSGVAVALPRTRSRRPGRRDDRIRVPRRQRREIAMAIGRECASTRPPICWRQDRQQRRLSELGIAAPVRLRGKRRGGRCAGSIGSSNVAFRGIKPDPATAIQASPDRTCMTGRRWGIAHSHIFSFGNSPTRADAGRQSGLGHPPTRRPGRARPLAACVVAQRSTSGLSQTFTRPLPKLRTGRGMSGYRCW